MKLLLVEDEPFISLPMEQMLKKEKYVIDVAMDGQVGFDFALTNSYDLIILDIMLPKMNGLEILTAIRQNNIQTPVLLLTAKSQVSDKIKGLDAGADDYLAKPFDFQELLARVRALLRRNVELEETNYLTFGNVCLDLSTNEMKNDSLRTQITLKEAPILALLIRRQKSTTSKELIIHKVWPYDCDVLENVVEQYISNLRKSLAQIKADIKIKTIRGLGYRLEEC
ncbi:MAG: response regulator transcription factor [Streptococcaceae bacterium]|jgi:DNA-binding response OmpR family regulator|nr:response regulator transcription factor [Streptococcaceae bacterium]